MSSDSFSYSSLAESPFTTNEGGGGGGDKGDALVLYIKSIDHPTDTLTAHSSDSVQSLVERLQILRQIENGKAIRLIFQGRLLDPRISLAEARLTDSCALHCVVVASSSSTTSSVPSTQPSPAPTSSASPTLRASLSSSGDGSFRINIGSTTITPSSSQPHGAPLRGLNRLAAYGFSPDDIEQVRSTYRAERMDETGDLPLPPATIASDASPSDAQLDEEDRWLNELIANSRLQPPSSFSSANNTNQDSHSLSSASSLTSSELVSPAAFFASSSRGTGAELLFGLILGALLGGLMLFWLWDSSLSFRAKVGIILGVALNVIITLISRLVLL